MDWSKSDLKAIFKQLYSYLEEDEEIEAVAVSHSGNNSLYIKPCLLATDVRLVMVEPKFLGLKAKPRGVSYDQLADVHVEEGIFTSKVSVTPMPGAGPAMVVDWVGKSRARNFKQYVDERIAAANTGERARTQKSPQSSPLADDPIALKLTQLRQLKGYGVVC